MARIYDPHGTDDAVVLVEQVLTPDVDTGAAVFEILDSEHAAYSAAPPTLSGTAVFIVEAAHYWPAVALLWSGRALRLDCTDPWHLDLEFVATGVRVSPVAGPSSRRRLDVSWTQVQAQVG